MGTAFVAVEPSTRAQPTLLSTVPQKGPYNGAVMVYSGKGSRLDPSTALSAKPDAMMDALCESASIISTKSKPGRLHKPADGTKRPVPAIGASSTHSAAQPQHNSHQGFSTQIPVNDPRRQRVKTSSSPAPASVFRPRTLQTNTMTINKSRQDPHPPPNPDITHSPLPMQSRSRTPTLSLASTRSEPHPSQRTRVHFEINKNVRADRAHSDTAPTQPNQPPPSPPRPILKKAASTQSLGSVGKRAQTPGGQSVASRHRDGGGTMNWRPIFAHSYAPLASTMEDQGEEGDCTLSSTHESQGTVERVTVTTTSDMGAAVKPARYRRNKHFETVGSRRRGRQGDHSERAEKVKSGCSFDECCVVCMVIDSYAE